MHTYTTVNNGCLVHFFFVEQVEFLLFPLFWFQPLLGMFLPGHVPFAQLMAFHGVCSFGQEFLYFGPLCHKAMQTSSEIIQTIILSHLSIKDCDTFIMTPRSRHPAKASTTNSNKQNYHHRGCPGESWACVRVRLHICMCVYMCVCHTCWVGPLDYPDKSH